MGVELKHFPLLAGTLDAIVVVEGRTLTSRPRTGARSESVPVAPGYELKVCNDAMLCEETELDLVAGDIEESGIGLEDLSEDGE